MVWRLLAGMGASLNILDGLLTCMELERGLIHEQNLFMKLAYVYSVPLFFLIKVFAVGLFVFLSRKEENPLARAGIAVGLLAYVGVFALHVLGLFA